MNILEITKVDLIIRELFHNTRVAFILLDYLSRMKCGK